MYKVYPQELSVLREKEVIL